MAMFCCHSTFIAIKRITQTPNFRGYRIGKIHTLVKIKEKGKEPSPIAQRKKKKKKKKKQEKEEQERE